MAFLKQTVVISIITALVISFAAIPVKASVATVGSFIGLLSLLDDFLSSQIGSATGDAKSVLADTEHKIKVLKNDLSETYKNDLSVTLDSIDEATGTQLVKLNQSANQLFNKLSESINSGSVLSEKVADEFRLSCVDTTNTLRDIQNDFKNTGNGIVNLAAVAFVRTVALIVCILLLGVFCLVGALSEKKKPKLVLGGIAAVVITALFCFTDLADLAVARPLKRDVGTFISMFAPNNFTIGEKRQLAIVGSNLKIANTPLRLEGVSGQFSISPKTVTETQIIAEIDSPNTAKEGTYPLTVSGGKLLSPVTKQLRFAFKKERSVLNCKYSVKGFKNVQHNWNNTYEIAVDSVWGSDNGTRKSGTLTPPDGYQLTGFTEHLSHSRGEKGPEIYRVSKDGNSVTYDVYAKHGPRWDRWRNLNLVTITLHAVKADKEETSHSGTIFTEPLVLKAGESKSIATISGLPKGSVELPNFLTFQITTRHPNGTETSNGVTMTADEPGDGNVGGVQIQKRGDTLFLNFPG